MAIEIRNLSFLFGENVILSGLSLSVETGQKVCVHFRQGTGATTLAKLCCGLLPSSGEVSVFGKPPKPEDQNISFLLSRPLFFERKTAKQNLEYVAKVQKRKVEQNEIEEVLERYSILSGDRPKRMNLRQKVLLSLARAEFANKQILIVDDILNGLDKTDAKEIELQLLRMSKNKTVLFFDSTKTKLDGFVQKCMVFGRIYDVPKSGEKAEVFFARQIANQNEEFVIADVCVKQQKTYLVWGEGEHLVDAKQADILKDRRIENVFVCFGKKGEVVAVFDQMDERFVF